MLTPGSTLRIAPALILALACSGCLGRKASVKAWEDPDLHLNDPVAFRGHAVNQKIVDVFRTKLRPAKGDTPLKLMPKGTRQLPVVNPGFEFTLNGGEAPPVEDYWLLFPVKGEPGMINGGGEGKMSDPIQGWDSHGCPGLESGRSMKQWKTPPDGVTGYILAQGRDNYLYQTLPGELKPSTRYTMVIEIYKRNDYHRATADQIILEFADGQGKPIDAVVADYHITPASKTTGYGVCLVTLVSHADQAPGDLMLKVGMNAEGPIRANYDNILVFAQPVK